MNIFFTVPGEPCGKGRARATIRAGHATMYTPAKTVNYEALVKMCALQQRKGELIKGPVALHITAVFGIPKSWSKKKLAQFAAGETVDYVTKKPDIDNIQKIIADALNGVVWVDDSQVVDSYSAKRYGHTPCVIVRVVDFARAAP